MFGNQKSSLINCVEPESRVDIPSPTKFEQKNLSQAKADHKYFAPRKKSAVNNLYRAKIQMFTKFELKSFPRLFRSSIVFS